MTLRFDGIVKPLRRGGWSARGVVIATRHGQLIETQIGPKEFPERELSEHWLRQIAAELSIETVRVTNGSGAFDRVIAAVGQVVPLARSV
ncbi:MAG: hypothetical protein ABIO40_00220 [Devosia sp.]